MPARAMRRIAVGWVSWCLAVVCPTGPLLAQVEDPRDPDWNTYHTTERAYALLDQPLLDR
jgi:hypothetical protein